MKHGHRKRFEYTTLLTFNMDDGTTDQEMQVAAGKRLENGFFPELPEKTQLC